MNAAAAATVANNSTSANQIGRKNSHRRMISGREGIIPAGNRQNPYSNMDIQPVNPSHMNVIQSIKGHDAAISS